MVKRSVNLSKSKFNKNMYLICGIILGAILIFSFSQITKPKSDVLLSGGLNSVFGSCELLEAYKANCKANYVSTTNPGDNCEEGTYSSVHGTFTVPFGRYGDRICAGGKNSDVIAYCNAGNWMFIKESSCLTDGYKCFESYSCETDSYTVKCEKPVDHCKTDPYHCQEKKDNDALWKCEETRDNNFCLRYVKDCAKNQECNEDKGKCESPPSSGS